MGKDQTSLFTHRESLHEVRTERTESTIIGWAGGGCMEWRWVCARMNERTCTCVHEPFVASSATAARNQRRPQLPPRRASPSLDHRDPSVRNIAVAFWAWPHRQFCLRRRRVERGENSLPINQQPNGRTPRQSPRPTAPTISIARI